MWRREEMFAFTSKIEEEQALKSKYLYKTKVMCRRIPQHTNQCERMSKPFTKIFIHDFFCDGILMIASDFVHLTSRIPWKNSYRFWCCAMRAYEQDALKVYYRGMMASIWL